MSLDLSCIQLVSIMLLGFDLEDSLSVVYIKWIKNHFLSSPKSNKCESFASLCFFWVDVWLCLSSHWFLVRILFFPLMSQFLYLFLQKDLADVTSHLSSLNLVIFLAWDILQYLPGGFSLPSLINSPKLLSNWTKQSRNFGRLWEESTNCAPHIHIQGTFNAWFRAVHSIFWINYVVSEFRAATLKI